MANTFTRKLQRGVGTTLTSVGSYTVPASTQVAAVGLSLANITAAAITVDVTLNDGTTDTYLLKDGPIPAGGTLVAIGGEQKVVLNTGDTIKVKSNTASSCDVILSLLELT